MCPSEQNETAQTALVTKLAKSLPQPFRPPLRRLWSLWQKRKVLRTPIPADRRGHTLPGELIVSLTSYALRFPTVHLTLRSLLLQSVMWDRLILWIAHGDIPLLPDAVRELEFFGLEVRECDDLRSYKKLVPAIECFPDAFIVTADDDLYYPPDWLRVLTNGFSAAEPAILARRVARVKRSSGGFAPFKDWEHDVQDNRARQPSNDLMPETGAGALYPPGSLSAKVTDRALFERLAPSGDDLWFYWCARLAGTPVRKVGNSLVVTGWSGSAASALWNENQLGRNDEMIRALEEEFGVASLGLPA
jgi:hypothetical protein